MASSPSLRAGISYLSGQDGAILPARDYPESHIINILLTKPVVRSRWLGIGLVIFFSNLANIQPSRPHTWSTTHIYNKLKKKNLGLTLQDAQTVTQPRSQGFS